MTRFTKRQENVIPNQGKQKQSIETEIGTQDHPDVRISSKDFKTTVINLLKYIRLA